MGDLDMRTISSGARIPGLPRLGNPALLLLRLTYTADGICYGARNSGRELGRVVR